MTRLLLSTTLFFISTLGCSGNYVWDLTNDPTESENLFDSPEYEEVRDYMKERLEYWEGFLVHGDATDSSCETQETYFDVCGGICPYVDNDYSMDIEQIYFPENPPNIIFILVDDWGWNDVGYRSNYMNWTTPAIDKLASEGIVFDNYFTHSFCVPTRAAILTGRFAGRMGMLEDDDGNELPLDEVTIAQELKSAGYRTHMVGKWHLGASSNARLPTKRGFDSFYGYYSGYIDYFTKTFGDYLDLHSDLTLVTNELETTRELHSAYLFNKKAEAVIADHANNYADSPLFLLYSMQLMHFPFTAAPDFNKRCAGFIKDYNDNMNYCGMNLMLDEAIANITCALEAYSLQSNTIMIVSSDNGGVEEIPGTSEPYRGHKYDFARGGVSANAFITSNLIPSSRRGSVYTGQMHASDWLPTLMSLVTDGEWTGSYANATIDGVDMWDAVLNDKASPRTEIPLYVNDRGHGSIIVNMTKLDYNISWVDVDTPMYTFPYDHAQQYRQYSCKSPELLLTTESASESSFSKSRPGHSANAASDTAESSSGTDVADTDVADIDSTGEDGSVVGLNATATIVIVDGKEFIYLQLTERSLYVSAAVIAALVVAVSLYIILSGVVAGNDIVPDELIEVYAADPSVPIGSTTKRLKALVTRVDNPEDMLSSNY